MQYTFLPGSTITKEVAANNGTEDTEIQDHGGAVTDQQIIVTIEAQTTPVGGDYVDVIPTWSVGDLKADPDAGPPTMTSFEHGVPIKFNLYVDGAPASPCTRAIPVPNGMKFSGLRFINRSGATLVDVWAERGS